MLINIAKKLSYNITLTEEEKKLFFENFKLITKELFKVSKVK
jgi:hypothetical protein